jgi:uncharacterized protein YcnI
MTKTNKIRRNTWMNVSYRNVLSILLTVVLLLGLAPAALAHVVVYPVQVTQGSYEKFIVRVPTEKDIATTQVEVRFPEGVEISRFEPKPGWTYEIAKDGTGKLTGVIWKATGAGLGATEFGEFMMQGKIANDATTLVWKAYQTYQDGSVVEWVGAEGSDKPASVSRVAPKPAGADSHGHGAVPAEAAASEGAGSWAHYLSVASLILSIAALLLAIRRRR